MPKTKDTAETTNYLLRNLPLRIKARARERATMERRTIRDVLIEMLDVYGRHGMDEVRKVNR